MGVLCRCLCLQSLLPLTPILLTPIRWKRAPLQPQENSSMLAASRFVTFQLITMPRSCFKFHRSLPLSSLTFTLFGSSVCTQNQFSAPHRTLRPLYVKPAAGTSWMMAMLFSGYLVLSGIPAPAFISLASFSYIHNPKIPWLWLMCTKFGGEQILYINFHSNVV